jgi:hypothetical protein
VSTGAPAEALSAFATTALADAKAAARTKPDARVMEAFGLGWQMAEIYRPDPAPESPPEPGDLPDLSQLDDADWTQIGLYQIQAGITKLRETITVAGLDVPEAEDFARRLRLLAPEERPGALRRFHVDLLATLTAADYRLGKAYGLGVALADLTREPASYRTGLQDARVRIIAGWIRDLATAFPEHASHAVASSLESWSGWAAGIGDGGTGEAEVVPQLSAQGRLWRSLLSGEKRATDVLEQSDYLTAGERVIQNAGSLARRFLRHYIWACVAAVLLFAAGIVVMFVVGSAAGVVSGATAILAGVGLGWKTIGTSLGAAAARVESPLWGAALDDAVYLRITPKHVVEQAAGGPRPPLL